jgi:hypothetical protein
MGDTKKPVKKSKPNNRPAPAIHVNDDGTATQGSETYGSS